MFAKGDKMREEGIDKRETSPKNKAQRGRVNSTANTVTKKSLSMPFAFTIMRKAVFSFVLFSW